AGAHDLDNTLLHGSTISQPNVEAVGVLAGNGLQNMIATGRNFHHAVGYHNQLGLKGPLVSSDGACVSIPGGAILHEQPLSLDVSPLLLELAEK
ncbi:HAD hydrolase family protein, partial [Acinetobacter baumannii]